MSTNPQIILEKFLEQKREEIDPCCDPGEFFNYFITQEILKDFELSYDEIQNGIVDGGGDGGIDAIYTLVNGELIQRDTEEITAKRNVVIDLYLIQSKNQNSFGETPLDKCIASAKDIFDLTKDIDDLRQVYNNELLLNVQTFRDVYLKLASRFPKVIVHYIYAAKGTKVDPNVQRKVPNLQESVRRLIDNVECNFDFLTAQSILEILRKQPVQAKDLQLEDNPISTRDGGYIAIVPIKNYYDFISDENGVLLKYFFDANIRDYQGGVEVNKAIKATLEERNPNEDFWWLNNGVTITASKASFAGKRLHLEEPQIVNGLQSSFEIQKYFRSNIIENEQRNLLVRIIVPESEESRLKVIKATNSQTNIPPASLRATDPIHRDIEDFLFANSFYYDRRKNYYKNQGKPVSQIVSISYLAQIIMGVLLQEPDYARARPSSLIKRDADYRRIFNQDLPIEMYLKVVQIQRITEELMKRSTDPELSRANFGDLRFHVPMYVCCAACGKLNPTAQDIAAMDVDDITEELVHEAITNVYIIYDSLGGNTPVAKGKEFVTEVLEIIKEKYGS